MRFANIELWPSRTGFKGQDEDTGFSATWPLFLIQEAWRLGADYEGLADGFGPGEGTHGDWSAIRDSTPEAINAMFEVALNTVFGPKCDCGFAYIPLRARHTPECAVTGQIRKASLVVCDGFPTCESCECTALSGFPWACPRCNRDFDADKHPLCIDCNAPLFVSTLEAPGECHGPDCFLRGERA